MGIDKALVTDRNAIDETNDTIEQEGQAGAGMQSQLSSIGVQRKRTTKARFIQTEDFDAWLTIGLNNPYKLAWDIFVILLAVYNCLMIPLSFSFQPAFLQSLTGVDKAVDYMYWIDIAIAFRTQKMLDDGTHLNTN